MANANLSTKRLQIDKANVAIVIATSVAVFVTIFSLVASYSLLGQRSYQAKVISQKEKAKNQLDENIKSVDKLVSSYEQFVASETNSIGGTKTGTSDRDGDNAKIILDALPSKYDVPALATSLEKIITDNGTAISNIAVTDNEAGQVNATSDAPLEIPFQVSLTGNYSSLQSMLGVFERSIRPMSIINIKVGGKDDKLDMTVVAKTYYQPEKTLTIKSEIVK